MTGPVRVPKMQRVVSVPVYWLIVGLCVMMASPVLSVLAATTIAKGNAAKQLQTQQDAQAAARAEAHQVTCAFFGSSMDVYRENPPISDAGRAQQANYAELYRITGCQPPRSK